MAKGKGGLGRGLGALLPDYDQREQGTKDENVVLQLPLEQVIVNPDQPRKHFDEDLMTDLIESVREHGVLQPIIVSASGSQYMIVAGERRYRASKLAGCETIPAIVKQLNEDQIYEIALIENIQRADLSPVEEARGYKWLQERFGYTMEQIATRMGKSRPQITNIIRLLQLPDEVLQLLEEEKLSIGHVRPLLTIEDTDFQRDFAHEIYQSKLSVREVEAMIAKIKNDGAVKSETVDILFEQPTSKQSMSDHMKSIQEQLKIRLGTKVSIKNKGKTGKIEIEFYGEEDLKRVLDALGGEYY